MTSTTGTAQRVCAGANLLHANLTSKVLHGISLKSDPVIHKEHIEACTIFASMSSHLKGDIWPQGMGVLDLIREEAGVQRPRKDGHALGREALRAVIVCQVVHIGASKPVHETCTAHRLSW